MRDIYYVHTFEIKKNTIKKGKILQLFKNNYLLIIIILFICSGIYMFWLLLISVCFVVNIPNIVTNTKAISKKNIYMYYLQHCIENYNSPRPTIFQLDLNRLKQYLLISLEKTTPVDIRCRKEMPNKVVIEVEEKQPKALLIKNGHILGIDKNGEIFKLMREYDLPFITGIDHKLDKDSSIPLALFILKILEKEDYLISEINIADKDDIKIYLLGGCMVKLGSRDNLKSKLEKLKRLLAIGFISRDIKLVDLRFKDIIFKEVTAEAQKHGSDED